MKKLFFLLFFIPALSCQPQPSEKDQKDKLETRVMAVHDDAMAEMDRIYKLRKELRRLQDTLSTRQTDSTTLKKLSRHGLLLQQADEGMMDWMRRYKAPSAAMPHDSAMQYLKQQLHKIERVQTRIDSTITAAEKIIKEYEDQK